jgi:SAP domain-containing ribonucleoprotein
MSTCFKLLFCRLRECLDLRLGASTRFEVLPYSGMLGAPPGTQRNWLLAFCSLASSDHPHQQFYLTLHLHLHPRFAARIRTITCAQYSKMVDYTKMKNAELETLLKQRSLPHSGKKADLVARLQEDDKKQEEGTTTTEALPAATTAALANEDEIDWDDDAAEPSKLSAPTAKPAVTASGTTQPPASTTPTMDAVKETNTATKDSGNAQVSNENNGDTKPGVDFSMGLRVTTIDEELEKRKARAKKFGIQETDPLAQEALQRLERAKKFGEEGGPRGLNEALPEQREKRRRDGGEDGSRDHKRRGAGRFAGRSGGRGDRRQQTNEGNTKRSGAPSWMNERDRAAAEARKSRFESR